MMTAPAFMRSTTAAEIRRGARRPGTEAVVITASGKAFPFLADAHNPAGTGFAYDQSIDTVAGGLLP